MARAGLDGNESLLMNRTFPKQTKPREKNTRSKRMRSRRLYLMKNLVGLAQLSDRLEAHRLLKIWCQKSEVIHAYVDAQNDLSDALLAAGHTIQAAFVREDGQIANANGFMEGLNLLVRVESRP